MARTSDDGFTRKVPAESGLPSQKRPDVAGVPGKAHVPAPGDRKPDGHEGATEDQVGDRTGPGVGYDQEPDKDQGDAGVGVS